MVRSRPFMIGRNLFLVCATCKDIFTKYVNIIDVHILLSTREEEICGSQLVTNFSGHLNSPTEGSIATNNITLSATEILKKKKSNCVIRF